MGRIGILGGTFDPVHTAHLELASCALEQYQLDVVLFIPAGLPVRKLGKTSASPIQRLTMLNLACADSPRFEVSTIEIDRGGVSYTIDTLHELRKHYGADDEFFLIVGEDSVADISTWKHASEIAESVVILYAKRPGGSDTLSLPDGFTCYGLEMAERELSSSKVRELLLEGVEGLEGLVPSAVLDYIQAQGLYGTTT